MRAAAIMVLAVFFTVTAVAAEKGPYELIAFDYSEMALETGSSVHIQWSGKVESLRTFKGKCRVVMTMTMENGEQHKYQTAPFELQGFGEIEVSDTFVVPRSLWDHAVSIEVGAEGYSDGNGA